MRRLGLIGGLGPGATVYYYQELAKSQPGEMMIVHADMERAVGYVQRGEKDELARYLAGLIERLAMGGADIAAVSAVTPHICIRELAKISPLPLVDILETTGAAVRARGYRRVALFGTRFVVESRLFGMLEGVDVIVPEQVEEIHEAYLEIVRGGSAGRNTLIRIAGELPVDAIVMAGTDLNVVFDESNTPFPHVDCAKEHVRAILRAVQTQLS